jgi:tetratricopeptide (TPR) repeat protein
MNTILKQLLKGHEDRFGNAIIYIAFLLVSLVVAVVLLGVLHGTGIGELKMFGIKAEFSGPSLLFLVTLLILIKSFDSPTNELTLKGNVYTHDLTTPVKGALVHVEGDARQVETNPTGYFAIEVNPQWTQWTLIASYNGQYSPPTTVRKNEASQIIQLVLPKKKVTQLLPPETTTRPVNFDRLPVPATELVGRKTELSQLTKAFKSSQKFVIALIAGGGVGKSALTWAWLDNLKKTNYGGAQRVFAWSFYSQGSHATQTSSTPFFQEAFKFFGYSGEEMPKDEVEKARLFFEQCLKPQPFLLILDGLEPLQRPVHLLDGEIADVAIKELLRQVRRYGLNKHSDKSLIVISSRQPLVELGSWEKEKYLTLELKTLQPAEGTKLLKNLEVQGTESELSATCENMGGHALALVLLGKLLVNHFQGDVRQRDRLPDLLEESNEEGQHAVRVLRYYDEKYWHNPNAPERIFLRLLGLFDRPLGLLEKEVLFNQAKYARPLADLSMQEWQVVEAHLERAGLLSKSSKTIRSEWECHPLIRNYFGQSFQKQQPEEFRQAHWVLFEYYQSVPTKPQPDTLEELEPLYRAVVHGCWAGEYRRALEEVYIKRILREDVGGEIEYYTQYKFGNYARELTVLSAFFAECWDKPVSSGLSEENQAFVLAETSFCLMALGRFTEAVNTRSLSMELYKKLENWSATARGAENLALMHMQLGQIQKAKQDAQQAVVYADQTTDFYSQRISHVRLAVILHSQGDLAGALNQFESVNKIPIDSYPKYHLWRYSLQGHAYHRLLLDQAINMTAREAVLKGGQEFFKCLTSQSSPFETVFYHLTIARILFALNHFKEAHLEFDQVVLGMREIGYLSRFPQVLLARANFFRHQQHFEDSQNDLNDAQEIIERCGMKFYAVDATLLAGHLYLEKRDLKKAKKNYAEAKKLIQVTGYHLRDPEVDLLGARLAFYQGEQSHALDSLKRARGRLEEMGYWGLLEEWEKVKKELGG